TYRVAGGAPGTAGGKAVVEAFAAAGGNVRQQPVGGADHRVLFMNHQRDTAQPGRYATGSGVVAAGAQYHRRLQLAQYLQRLPQGADQTYRCLQQPQLALAAQSLNIVEMQGDAGLVNRYGLDPAAGTQPVHVIGLFLQKPGTAQRREHVPAGTTGDDQRLTGHRQPPAAPDGAPSRSAAGCPG